ncbi:efflux transporter outer membrane subunit [Comamonas sp. Y6]|uniref:Efflux transporter outer membrane subunit n=1 Tax=Comamonas resistens TaxID=3046670 RepID=A0ABY8SRQ0_9BURK|nr:efflux transporter outer membrane subunit [Comamonas resistens]MDL5037091.1 efflux transporter outer membrane subunit [Comamonas resistens]WHS65707.1 efflux transporter outer membrane subunit [Comamonas resistens]
MACLCLCAMSLLAGCAAPVDVKLDKETPDLWRQQLTQKAGSADLAQWWKSWNDPALNALVDEALAQNLDVAQAVLRLRQQRLLAGASNATFMPVVSAGGKTLQDIAAVDSYFHASIDVSWDLGLFGDSQAARRSADAGVLDAQAQLHAARVALVADVVHRYLDIRQAQVQRGLALSQQQQAQRQLELLQVRQAQRLADTQTLEQQQLQLRGVQAQLTTLDEAQARAAHALAALLGRDRPEPQWLQADAAAALPQLQAIAVLPADLLRRRPDIQSAEAAVEQAAAEVGVSRAALYPRLTLTGSLLFAYNLTRNHRTTSDYIPMVGPQIDIPLFDWSRRRAVADGKELALQASIKAYRQAVLNGIAEAEGALAAIAAQQQRQQALLSAQQIHAARDKAQAVRQKLGLSSELTGLDNARASLQTQSELATAKAAEALAYVALYKAVGAAPLDEVAVVQKAEVQP